MDILSQFCSDRGIKFKKRDDLNTGDAIFEFMQGERGLKINISIEDQFNYTFEDIRAHMITKIVYWIKEGEK
jgi:hypothetical protein